MNKGGGSKIYSCKNDKSQFGDAIWMAIYEQNGRMNKRINVSLKMIDTFGSFEGTYIDQSKVGQEEYKLQKLCSNWRNINESIMRKDSEDEESWQSAWNGNLICPFFITFGNLFSTLQVSHHTPNSFTFIY